MMHSNTEGLTRVSLFSGAYFGGMFILDEVKNWHTK